MEHRLPIVTRWALYALGAVEGQRVRRPRDPVAAWLLRRHPKLLPTFAAPSILSMIRARSAIVDRMIEDEVHRARRSGQRLAVFTFGAGFDARWYRLRPLVQDVVTSHTEVEDPEVLEFKNGALADSSFAGVWDLVRRLPLREDRWTVHETSGDPTLVILEGVASRLGVEGLKRLLGRIRHDAPHAHVLVDLPGVLQTSNAAPTVAIGSSRTRWSSPNGTGASSVHLRDLRRLGWRPHEDSWFASRPELRAPSGMAICSGMEALRVLHLVPG